MPVPAQPLADPTDPAQVVTSAWADQALWSAVATRLSNAIRSWRQRAAAAGVAGLFCSLLATTMASNSDGQRAVATLGVLLLAVVPVLQQRLLSADRVLAWTRSRLVAEQLQSAIYRHLMGVLPPMPNDDGSPAADPQGPGNLVRHCRAIKRDAADLALLAATTVVTPQPGKTVLTVQDYLADRVDDQIGWYRAKAMTFGKEAQNLQRLEFALGLLSVVLSALVGNLLPAAATPGLLQGADLAPWLALIASACAAITTHSAGTRNLEISAKYYATQDLLRTLRDEWQVDPERDTPARVQRLVNDAEATMAAEHGGWVKGWAQAAQQGGAAAAANAAEAPAAGVAASPEPAEPVQPVEPPEPAGPAAPEPEPEPAQDAGAGAGADGAPGARSAGG